MLFKVVLVFVFCFPSHPPYIVMIVFDYNVVTVAGDVLLSPLSVEVYEVYLPKIHNIEPRLIID